MDRYIIHEFRTSDGIYQIDYDSLANLPDLAPKLTQGSGISIVSGPNDSQEISVDPEIQVNIGKLMNKVFPITANIVSSSGFGTYEEGDIVTPQISWTVTRDNIEVSSYQVTPMIQIGSSGWVSKQTTQNLGTYSPGEVTTNTAVKLIIQDSSEEVTIGPLYTKFTKYRYYGVLTTRPTTITEELVRALGHSELSTASTLGSTGLAAGRYFLFVCPGTITLKVRHAGTDSVIESESGTLEMHRQNGTGGTITYSWILVPSSDIYWSFTIKNN